MGYGSYKASDWAKLKNSRGISSNSNADSLFSNNQFQDKYNPRFIDLRESCDSADSPLSTPIILGFDVTGSMGYLAAEIAKNSLNKTITELYNKQPVTNPHVMCAAFTSPECEGALQVTQYEADIRVVEQLLELKVGFGWNRYSFDSLVWYFAAKHTKIDCFDKRGKKGFLFCIGDEVCGASKNEDLVPAELKKIFADQTKKSLGIRTILEMASQKYEVFHIVTETNGRSNYPSWQEFMPGRVALLEPDNINCLSEVITSLLQIAKGETKEAVIRQWPKETETILERALKDINPSLFTGS